MASQSKNPNPKAPLEHSPGARSSVASPMDTSPKVTPSTSPTMAMSVDEPPLVLSTATHALNVKAPLPPKPPTKKPKRKAPSSSQPSAPLPKRSSNRLKSKITRSSSQGTGETVEVSDESSAHASDENFVPEKEKDQTEDSFERWLGDDDVPLADIMKKSSKGKGKQSATSHATSKKETSKVTPTVSSKSVKSVKSPASRATSRATSLVASHAVSESSDDAFEKGLDDNVFPNPHFSLEFYKKENMLSMVNHSSKKLHKERYIDEDDLKVHGVYQFLKDRKFLNANLYPSTFVEGVVRNFYANLHANLDNTSSDLYGKVFVRGKTYSFTSTLINKTLKLKEVVEDNALVSRDEIARFLTNNVVDAWPKKKNDKTKFDHLLASRLTSLFSVLHKLCILNWLPTTNEQYVTLEQARMLYKLGKRKEVNLGWLVFRHLASWGRKSEFSMFPYPSLVFQVLKAQGLPLVDSDTYTQDLDYYRVDSLLTKKGQGGVRYTGDLPWDKSKDAGSSAVPSVASHDMPDIPPMPNVPPRFPSSFSGTEAANMINMMANVPTIPTTLVLDFLTKHVASVGEFINHILSSQPGGDGVGPSNDAGVGPSTNVAAADAVPDATVDGDDSGDAGIGAEPDIGEEQDEDEEDEEEGEGNEEEDEEDDV